MNIKPVHCVVVHEHKVGGELVLVGKGEGGQVRGLGADTEPGLARGRGGDMKVRGKPLNIGLEKKDLCGRKPLEGDQVIGEDEVGVHPVLRTQWFWKMQKIKLGRFHELF